MAAPKQMRIYYAIPDRYRDECIYLIDETFMQIANRIRGRNLSRKTISKKCDIPVGAIGRMYRYFYHPIRKSHLIKLLDFLDVKNYKFEAVRVVKKSKDELDPALLYEKNFCLDKEEINKDRKRGRNSDPRIYCIVKDLYSDKIAHLDSIDFKNLSDMILLAQRQEFAKCITTSETFEFDISSLEVAPLNTTETKWQEDAYVSINLNYPPKINWREVACRCGLTKDAIKHFRYKENHPIRLSSLEKIKSAYKLRVVIENITEDDNPNTKYDIILPKR